MDDANGIASTQVRGEDKELDRWLERMEEHIRVLGRIQREDLAYRIAAGQVEANHLIGTLGRAETSDVGKQIIAHALAIREVHGQDPRGMVFDLREPGRREPGADPGGREPGACSRGEEAEEEAAEEPAGAGCHGEFGAELSLVPGPEGDR